MVIMRRKYYIILQTGITFMKKGAGILTYRKVAEMAEVTFPPGITEYQEKWMTLIDVINIG